VRGLDPRRGALGDPLLIKGITPVVRAGGQFHPFRHAARPALQRGRPVLQSAQDALADGQVVLDDVQLADPHVGEVGLVRVAHPDGPVTDLQLDRGRRHGGRVRDVS
jgi:hypothetical protein